jgi:hypothetical protein
MKSDQDGQHKADQCDLPYPHHYEGRGILMRYITLDGKKYTWKEILKLRREQKKAARQAQQTLFELREDTRPQSQRTASSRYEEPTLFD